MNNDISTLLTASSILLGILTALFGLFYPDLKHVLDIIPKKHKADNKQEFDKSKEIVSSKYIPLLLGSLIISLLFTPELIKQIHSSIEVIKIYGIKNTSYCTLTASFIAVCCFMILIAVFMVRIGCKMKTKIDKLNPN